MNDVLRDILNCFVSIYLDNILIFSRNPQEDQDHIWMELQWLFENRLFVKAEKCEFHVQSILFVGFIIGRGQMRSDPAKVKAAMESLTPGTQKQLQ